MSRFPRSHQQTLALGAQSLRVAKAKLSPPPSSYEPDSHYRVHLGKSIEMPNGTWMRPTDDIVVTGAFATEIAANIIAADIVAGPKA